MTTFQDLQTQHEQLLTRHEADEDTPQFWADVQHFIEHVRIAAEDIAAPRDRDQLRAILRFWSSYVYTKTGAYPDTTIRPATSSAGAESSESVPPETKPEVPEAEWKPGWRTYLLAAVVLALLIGMFALVRFGGNSAAPAIVPPVTVQPNANASASTQLELTVHEVTSGPSPFNSNIWVVRFEISATGGNGAYIFWVNGQRLPEQSNNQFTVESQGCQPVSQFVGVTSGGLAKQQELIVHPPEPNTCSK